MTNKYKLFNNIKIDDSNYKKYILSDNDKNNIFNNIKNEIQKEESFKNQKYKKLAVASIICVCVSSVVLSNDRVWAMVESIGQQIEQLLGKPEKEYEGFKVEVNQSVTDSGLKVNLSEAMLNDGELVLSVGVDRSDFDNSQYEKPFYSDPYFYFNNPTIYIDNKKFVQSSGWGGHESRDGKVQEFIEAYSLSSIDTDNDGIPEIENYEILDNINPNKDYEVRVVFDELGLRQIGVLPMFMKEKFDTVKGNWEFKFTINGKNIINQTQSFEINEEVDVQNESGSGKIIIDSLRISPVSARIKYTTEESKELNKSLGDKTPYHLGIELFDQDGNSISGGGGASSEDGIIYDVEMNALLDNYKDLKKIYIVPYVYSTEKDPKFPKQNKQIFFKDKAIEIKLKN